MGLPPSAEAGEVIGKVGKLGGAEAAQRFCHGSLCADAGARLIVPERPDERGRALTREPGHLIAAGEVGIMADSADAFALAAARFVGNGRWWQCGYAIGNGGKLGVAHVFGDGMHLGIGAPAFAIEEQLVHDEQLGCAPIEGTLGSGDRPVSP